MLIRDFLKTIIFGLPGFVFVVLLLPGQGMCEPLLLARAPVTDIIITPPPPEIRQVPPPAEIRQLPAPPEDLRKIAPPPPTSAPADVSKTNAVAVSTAANLAVVSVGVSNSTPKVGERVMVTARLRNSGTIAAKRIKVRFLTGARQVGERSIDLPPGNSDASASFVAENPGTLEVSAVLDCPTCPRLATVRHLMVGEAETADSSRITKKTGPSSGIDVASSRKILPPGKPKGYAPGPDLIQQGPQVPPVNGGPGEGLPQIPGGSGPGVGIPQIPGGGGPGSDILGLDTGTGGPDTGKLGSGIPKRPTFAKTPGGGDIGGVWQSKKGGIGPGKWAAGDGGESSGYEKGIGLFYGGARDTAEGKNNGVTFYQDEKGNCVIKTEKNDGSSETTIFTEDGNGFVNIEYDNQGRMTQEYTGRYDTGKVSETTFNKDGSYNRTYYNIKTLKRGTPIYVDKKHGGKGEDIDGTDAKFDPRTMDPLMRQQLAKYLPRRHIDPRLGRVGDPPRLVVSATSGAAADGAEKSMAGPTGGGGGKVEAQWVFAGMKPGWTLTGGGREGEGKKDLSHLGPITPLKKFILPDPPESKAIKAALAETPGKGAALRVTAVSGSVQKLTVQGGQQGWAPLESGDTIAPSAIIRVDNQTGGMVQVGSAFKQAGQQKWEKIHEDSNHTVHVLKGK